jgi:16S rRNA (guanine527-N7)-methyltransferase
VTSREFRERLRRRTSKSGFVPPPELVTALEAYYQLLATWNEKINLTALNLRDGSDDAFDRLLVEPLVAARHVPIDARRMMDIGSGGGSPAIPMKLAAGRLELIMVESKTRKSVFLREAIRMLDLREADVVTGRIEELLTRPALHESQDVITIRAVRVEVKVLGVLQAFLRLGGHLFMFRSATTGDPIASITPPLTWHATYPLVDSARTKLVVLEKLRVR